MDSIVNSFSSYCRKRMNIVLFLMVLTVTGVAFHALRCNREGRSDDLSEGDDVVANTGHIVGGRELILPFTRGGSVEQILSGKYLYMSFSSAVPTEQFRIVDISDVSCPYVVSGDKLSLPINSRGLDVSGNYAFIGTDLGQFRIIDISNPANPFVVGGESLSFSNAVRAVKVVGNYAYLGIYDFNGINDQSLIILDISEPTHPIQVSPVTVKGLVSEVRSLDVAGGFAYLVSYWDDNQPGNTSNNVLRIVDVRDPYNPFVVGGTMLNLPNYARQIKVVGRYAYVVFDAFGTSNGIDNGLTADQYFRIVDISNKEEPFVVSGASLPFVSISDTGGLKSVYVVDYLAFVTECQSNDLLVIDVNDPYNPVIKSSFNVRLGVGVWSVLVSGRYAYVGCSGHSDKDVLRIIDIGGILERKP